MFFSFLRILVLAIFVALFSSTITKSGQSKTTTNLLPLSSSDSNWIIQPNFSDEFNDESLNPDLWDNTMYSWGRVSWDPENVYVQNGNLHLKIEYKVQQYKRKGPGNQLWTKNRNMPAGIPDSHGEDRVPGRGYYFWSEYPDHSHRDRGAW